MNHRRFTVGKKGIGHSRDGFTRRRPRDLGQDEKREEPTDPAKMRARQACQRFVARNDEEKDNKRE